MFSALCCILGQVEMSDTELWHTPGDEENLYGTDSEGQGADKIEWLWCWVRGKAVWLVLSIFPHLSAVIYKAVASMRWMTLQVA